MLPAHQPHSGAQRGARRPCCPGLGRGRQPFRKEAPGGCPHLSPMDPSLPSLVTDSFQKKQGNGAHGSWGARAPRTRRLQKQRCAAVLQPRCGSRVLGWPPGSGWWASRCRTRSGAPLRMFAERRKSWPWLCPRLALSDSFPTAGETPAWCTPPRAHSFGGPRGKGLSPRHCPRPCCSLGWSCRNHWS